MKSCFHWSAWRRKQYRDVGGHGAGWFLSDELDRLKASDEALAQAYLDAGGVLGRRRSNLPCVFCDSSDAFSLHRVKDRAHFKCHKCGASGSIVDLAAKTAGLNARDDEHAKQACKLALEKYAGVTTRPPKLTSSKRKEGKTYATGLEAEAALDHWLSREGFTLTKAWTYELPSVKRPGAWMPAIKVVRFDHTKPLDGQPAKKKQIRPIHRVKHGWRIGLGPWGKTRKCPLYNLQAIVKRLGEGGKLPPLFVVEGEKCAERLIELGLFATTSQGGSGRAAETDWKAVADWMLVGGEVIFWPDADGETGGGYVDEAARAALSAWADLDPGAPARTFRVEPAALGLKGKEDCFDWLAARPDATAEDLLGVVAEVRAAWKPEPIASKPGVAAGGGGGGGGFGARTAATTTGAVETGASDGTPAIPAPLGSARRGGEQRPVLTNYVWRAVWEPDKKEIQKALKECEDADEAAKIYEQEALLRNWPEHVDPFSDSEAPSAGGEDGPDDKQRAAMRAAIERFGAVRAKKQAAKDIGRLREDVQKLLGGWPHRIAAKSEQPRLFFDRGFEAGGIGEIHSPSHFMAMLKDYAEVRFMPGQDHKRANYVTVEELFRNFGSSEFVPEWIALEKFPHVPPLAGHYYCHQHPPGYVPDGKRLAQFVGFFDSLHSPKDRAVLAAAVLTVVWGGPYGKRPAFVFDAAKRGSGKTTAAEQICALVGGAFKVQLDRRAQERLIERLLSPIAKDQRTGLCDNVRSERPGEQLEELVTAEWISGKELGVGEGRRPNTLTYFVTANNARLGEDMNSRAYFARFDCLDEKAGADRSGWERLVMEFVKEHRREVVADACWMLMQPAPAFEWGAIKGERWPLWVEEVLARVWVCPALVEVIGDVSAPAVVAENQAYRQASNEDLEEAEQFMQGLLERVVAWKGITLGSSGALIAKDQTVLKQIFIRTEAPGEPETNDEFEAQGIKREYKLLLQNNMVSFWKAIFTRSDISSKWLGHRLKEHLENGRLKGLSYVKKRVWQFGREIEARGWLLDLAVVEAYLRGMDASQVSQAAD